MTRITFSLIIIFSFLSINYLIAKEKSINKRFKGKEKKLVEYLQTNLKYPANSLNEKSIGYSIASASITPEGKICNILVINPIDEDIDKEVVRVLMKSEKYWKKSDTLTENQTFYFQIVYSIAGINNRNNIEINSPVNEKYNFIEPVVITAMTFKSEHLPETNESIAMKCNDLMKVEKYDKALTYIDELIQRNPFNKELYQIRIYIYTKTGRNELIAKDVQKMNNFIPGVPLDELINLE